MKELYKGITYYKEYIPSVTIPAITAELLNLDWITKRAARHEYFMSNSKTEYSYGNAFGGAEQYTSQNMEPFIGSIMSLLNYDIGSNFNGCFLNKYDTDKQHLGYHADDFDGMDPDEPIAVISFGAEREIWVKPQKSECSGCCGTGVEKASVLDNTPHNFKCTICNDTGMIPTKGNIPDDQKILLEEGSLFVMPVGFQDDYFHRIPKHDRPCDWRISLTFRSFLN